MEKTFHSQCTIEDKMCELNIDGGSCPNVAFITLINKLKLPTKVHPTPYSPQWLRQGNEVIISKKALIAFSVSSYYDKVLCDVLLVDACHLLLAMLWLFDNYMIHDAHANTYAFKQKGRNLTLTPLPPHMPLKFKLMKGSENNLFMSETSV